MRRTPSPTLLSVLVVLLLPAWAAHAGPAVPWGRRVMVAEASLRLQVKPRHTQVYVDGYYAGIADDFDGTFQRLHTFPGEHEITLYLEGHRTLTQRIRVGRSTYRIRHTMEPLPAGEVAAKPPEPAAPPERPEPPDSYGRRPPGYPMPPEPRSERREPGRERPGPVRGGTIAVRVQPEDAEIFIDGERWQGPDGSRLDVEVPEGTHRVEVRKAGFEAFSANVQVRRGETTTVNVSLRRGGEVEE